MNETQESKPEEKKAETKDIVDSVIAVLKKNHNWKFFAGMVAAWIFLALV